MKPNAPRMITVVIGVLLMIVGIVLVFFQASALDAVRGVLSGDLQRQVVSLMSEKTVGWLFLAASPILLIIGSLVRGL